MFGGKELFSETVSKAMFMYVKNNIVIVIIIIIIIIINIIITINVIINIIIIIIITNDYKLNRLTQLFGCLIYTYTCYIFVC